MDPPKRCWDAKERADCGAPFLLSLFVVCRNLSRNQFRHNGVAGFSSGVTRDAVVRGKILFEHVAQLRHGVSPLMNVVPHGVLCIFKLLWSRPATASWPSGTWFSRSGGWSSTRANGHLLAFERRPACACWRLTCGMLGVLVLRPGYAQNFRNVGAANLDRFQIPGSRYRITLASDEPWLQRARPLPIQILRFDFHRYLKVLSLKHLFRSKMSPRVPL